MNPLQELGTAGKLSSEALSHMRDVAQWDDDTAWSPLVLRYFMRRLLDHIDAQEVDLEHQQSLDTLRRTPWEISQFDTER